ncbi:MAG: hypothetical protein QW728_03305, partial [Thermoplasmata archaeon]
SIFMLPGTKGYAVDVNKQVSDKIVKYMDGIIGAICSVWGQWHKTIMVSTMIVNGPVGMITPGGFTSPMPIGPLIIAQGPVSTPQEMKYTKAIANAVDSALKAWLAGLMGQVQYPAFAAFPGPMAPPMPCVPMPLMAFSSAMETMMGASMLKNMMVANLGDPQAQHSDPLFDAIAKALNTGFTMMKATTMVTNVLGTGPIPTFAPPFVPVGPVVGGTVVPTPGILT